MGNILAASFSSDDKVVAVLWKFLGESSLFAYIKCYRFGNMYICIHPGHDVNNVFKAYCPSNPRDNSTWALVIQAYVQSLGILDVEFLYPPEMVGLDVPYCSRYDSFGGSLDYGRFLFDNTVSVS
jgi:hypothetical protein